MKNKGFTLIELLTVLSILIIITLTIFPIIVNRIDSSKEKAYKIQIDSIKSATIDWALNIKNIPSIPEKNGEVLTLNLGDLKIGGYLDIDIKNPITGISFPNDMLITITKNGANYDVKVLEDTGTNVAYENIIVKESPIIVLNGSYLTYVELNEEYSEPGAYAYSYTGADLTGYIGREIIKSDTQVASIDSSSIGTYKIYYIIVDPDSEYKNSAIRTVIVRDTTAPQITLEEETEILLSEVSSFNYMAGVSVSDNSGEEINVTYTGTIENRVGSYIITYTAQDSNNNKTTKKRIIKVK